MATKKFNEYAIQGNNVTLTYDNVNDTVTFDVNVDKNDVGLGNVDNTSDINKPISTATQTALDGKASTIALTTHTNDLNNPHAVTKAQIGLGNVDNTSDLNKPISTATQTALNAKQDSLGFTAENVANKSISVTTDQASNTKYPSVKAVYDWASGLFATITQLGTKQDTLVSGTNIKTVNSNSLVGSGDVVIDKTSVGLGNVANVDTTNASNISSGTLADARLSTNVTTQGNTFNTASKLVQLDASAKLPAVDGSQLTNLPTFSPPNGLLKLASAISTTLQTVTDYLGNLSVLQLNSRRVGILSDSSVTTQTSAVIEAQTTNSNLVLKPNGTGAIVASIPDGTATGGNARGANAVDLQTSRATSQQVAAGTQTAILSGLNNTIQASGRQGVIVGGDSNLLNFAYNFLGGGQSNSAIGASYMFLGGGSNNTVSSNYSTISGGQSNTASTNTHATVVGGYQNTASGQYSVVGARSNTASGIESSIITGRSNIATGGASSVLASEYSSSNGYCSAVLCGYNSSTSPNSSYSAILGGDYGLSYLFGQITTGVRLGTTQGTAQSSYVQAYRETTLSVGQTANLSLDGTGTTNLIIPTNSRIWNVTVNWVAVCLNSGSGTTINGESSIGTDIFMFKYNSGTASSVISPITNIQNYAETSMIGAILNYSVLGTNTLKLQFTAPTTANNTQFRIVSKVSLVEVAY